ncbi:MAG: 50S ribosomal protein L11 methyltransferase [Bdellovibrionota bacterium]
MDNYVRVRFKNLTDQAEDILTSFVFEHGATGLSEPLAYVQPDLAFDPRLLHQKFHEVDAFFEGIPATDFFKGVTDIDPQIKWEVFTEPVKDWLEEWKKDYKPFRFVSDLWIVPTWLEAPPEAKLVIRIDPGMAFGTGTHATTQIAAAMINKVAKKAGEDFSLFKTLDVGCGTGVLSVAAFLYGSRDLYAMDVDPEALRVTRENFEKNQVIGGHIYEKPLNEINEKFDLVIANIIDGVLLQLKPDLLRAMTKGGSLVLSGILTDREDTFIEKFMDGTNLQIMQRLSKDDWAGFWLVDKS